jgi:hypothetical protein
MSGGGLKYLYFDFMPFAIGSSVGWAITQAILLPQFATDLSGASGSSSRLSTGTVRSPEGSVISRGHRLPMNSSWEAGLPSVRQL